MNYKLNTTVIILYNEFIVVFLYLAMPEQYENKRFIFRTNI